MSPSEALGGGGRPGPGEAAQAEFPAAYRHRLLGALLAALLGAGIALGLHTRLFLLTHIRIYGLRQVTAEEIQVDLGFPVDTFTWQVRPWVVARRLLRDPMIAAARAAVRWPHTLVVDIVERVPAALVAAPAGTWEVDAGGRLLRYIPSGGALPSWEAPPRGAPSALAGLPADLPRIRGVVLVDPVAGQPARGAGLAQTLSTALGLGAAGTGLTASVDWSRGVVELRLRDGLTANFGDGGQARRKTEILLGILQVAARQGVHLVGVDVSAPATPAVRLQPGSPPLVYAAAGSSGGAG